MARKHEAGRYLLDGLTPQEISGRMGVSLGSVRQYLCTLVGEGELLRSDIAFNIAERRLIEEPDPRGSKQGFLREVPIKAKGTASERGAARLAH